MALPVFNWVESSPSSIAVDTTPAEPNQWAWHSGRAVDVLHIDDDKIVVGSETGGVWIADPNGFARPVSNDWDFPNVLCLHRRIRPQGLSDLFCGTQGGLYRTDPNASEPIATWFLLNLPAGVTNVYRIVTHNFLIAIATNNGIWWDDHYLDGPVVNWHLARLRKTSGDIEDLTGAWSGLALTADAEFSAGTRTNTPFDWVGAAIGAAVDPYPLIAGKMAGADLVFEKAVGGIPAADLNGIGYVTVASCDADRKRVYAVTFHDAKIDEDGVLKDSKTRVFHLLRSDDGGKNWVQLPDTMTGPVHDAAINLRSMAKDAKAGGRIKNVSVHPTLKNRVAFAGYISFISDDSGDTWTAIGGTWAPPDADGVSRGWSHTTSHEHVDQHMVCFASEQGFSERVLVATDGGIIRAGDWRKPETFSSMHNRGLRTLQFYSPWVWRNFLGSISSTPASRGLVAGGLQDNGNVWKANFAGAFWVPSEGGDGGFNLAIGPGRYLHQNLDHKVDDPNDGAVRSESWAGLGSPLVSQGDVPVVDAAGQQTVAFLETALEPVRNPTFRDAGGKLLYGLGWRKNTLFGLFADDNADNCFWRSIAMLGGSETVQTASSFDGTEIIVASSAKTISRVDPATGAITPMAITGVPDIPGPPAPTKPAIARVLATGPASGFACFLDSPFSIARRDGDEWVKTASSPADPISTNSAMCGMDADDIDQSKPPILLVATDSRVFASINNGDNWSDVSNGLPKQPHCSDLRFNRYKRRWMLGTYGRSMWQSGNVVQVGVSSLLQGDFFADEDHKNFEALVLIGNELFHYFKDNREVANVWVRGARLTDKATAPACIIRSDYVLDADHRNLEALVLEGKELSHWFRDAQADGLPWSRVGLVTNEATGAASMIQSDYHDDEDHGNFEALIPMADGLWHWYRNNATGEWKKVARVNAIPNSAGCLISSDYSNEPGHRALEALVYERLPDNPVTGYLFHYYWSPAESKWNRTKEVTDLALGPGCLIQSDYIEGQPHKNLEALAWLLEDGVPVLRHFFRRDDIGSLDWVRGPLVTSGVQSSASMVQGDFHSDEDHGNFEVIVASWDNELWHHWRRQSDFLWLPGGTVT